MNRRSVLSSLVAVPFVGRLFSDEGYAEEPLIPARVTGTWRFYTDPPGAFPEYTAEELDAQADDWEAEGVGRRWAWKRENARKLRVYALASRPEREALLRVWNATNWWDGEPRVGDPRSGK